MFVFSAFAVMHVPFSCHVRHGVLQECLQSDDVLRHKEIRSKMVKFETFNLSQLSDPTNAKLPACSVLAEALHGSEDRRSSNC